MTKPVSTDPVFPAAGIANSAAAPLIGGITKRELFAAMAMQRMAKKDRGEYSAHDMSTGGYLNHPQWAADAAVDYADALLAALARTKN